MCGVSPAYETVCFCLPWRMSDGALFANASAFVNTFLTTFEQENQACSNCFVVWLFFVFLEERVLLHKICWFDPQQRSQKKKARWKTNVI